MSSASPMNLISTKNVHWGPGQAGKPAALSVGVPNPMENILCGLGEMPVMKKEALSTRRMSWQGSIRMPRSSRRTWIKGNACYWTSSQLRRTTPGYQHFM